MLQTWLGELKFQDVALNPAELASLQYMREEEKLAHDIYLAFHELWGKSVFPVFANIAESEKRHTDAIKWLINHYQLPDPASLVRGKFTESKLQNLYHELLKTGQVSIIAALQVSAALEEIDITDLNKILQSSVNPNIQRVYRELLQGSHDHLRAFVHQLQLNGIHYAPQTLELAEFEEILRAVTPAIPPTDVKNDVKKVVFMTQR
jgi:hypothetical protein